MSVESWQVLYITYTSKCTTPMSLVLRRRGILPTAAPPDPASPPQLPTDPRPPTPTRRTAKLRVQSRCWPLSTGDRST
eukprot:COSAG02_NODE_1623_length_11604_cov_27.111951_2_plen_78_part_00